MAANILELLAALAAGVITIAVSWSWAALGCLVLAALLPLSIAARRILPWEGFALSRS